MPANAPELLRLCPHVATETFRLGEGWEDFELDLETYADGFRDGDETLVYVLADDEGRVVAYEALSDLDLNHAELGPLRCLAIPVLAVDPAHRGRNSAMRLANQARRVLKLRQRAHLENHADPRYDGVACYPFGIKQEEVRALERLLRRLGFEPVPNDVWWFKPWEEEELRGEQ
jgi:GNAT superfamily N-acetyltransferase